MWKQVFAFKDREEIEFVVPTAITVEEYYDAPNLDILAPYKEEIEALIIKVGYFCSLFH